MNKEIKIECLRFGARLVKEFSVTEMKDGSCFLAYGGMSWNIERPPCTNILIPLFLDRVIDAIHYTTDWNIVVDDASIDVENDYVYLDDESHGVDFSIELTSEEINHTKEKLELLEKLVKMEKDLIAIYGGYTFESLMVWDDE